jgi:hypothetical protein
MADKLLVQNDLIPRKIGIDIRDPANHIECRRNLAPKGA